MDKNLVIILIIFAVLIVIAIVVMGFAFGWWKKLKLWYQFKRVPEHMISVRMHHDNSLYEDFFIKFTDQKFHFEDGTYLVTKDAIQHRRKIDKRNNFEVVGHLDYIYHYPFPVKFFSKDFIMADLLKREQEKNKKILEELQADKNLTEEQYEQAEAKLYGNMVLFTVDTDGLKDIERNTLVYQLLRALQDNQTLFWILIISAGALILGILIFCGQQGIIKLPPIQAVCTNISEKVVQR